MRTIKLSFRVSRKATKSQMLKLKFMASRMFLHLCGAFVNRFPSRMSYKFENSSKFQENETNPPQHDRSIIPGGKSECGFHLDC